MINELLLILFALVLLDVYDFLIKLNGVFFFIIATIGTTIKAPINTDKKYKNTIDGVTKKSKNNNIRIL